MELRKAYLGMIKAFPGGWDSMSSALGMSRMGLENRIYERKGQTLLVETAMQMQAFSGTTLFAEAVAHESGGVFLKLPDGAGHDREELLTKFNELYAELGTLSADFNRFTADNELDDKEQAALANEAQQIHRTVEELLALTCSIYGRHAGKAPAGN